MACTAPTDMAADPVSATPPAWAHSNQPALSSATARPQDSLAALPAGFGFTAAQLQVLTCQIMVYRKFNKARCTLCLRL